MLYVIGEIVKAQGVKGEVKVKPLSTDYTALKTLKLVYLDSMPHKLRSVSLRSGFAFIAFEGVIDRNAAELLVGKKVAVEKSSLPKLAEYEYYIDDIIGCSVALNSGEVLGKVVEIENFGAADVYYVSGEKNFSFPFLKKVIVSIDTDNKLIVLDKNRFAEVCVYED